MIALNGRKVTLLDGDLRRREADNRAYMLRLTRENLMRNYLLEAGLWTCPSLPEGIHGGWEAAQCQLRGHFAGHYLSASAMIFAATGDLEIKGKADMMVDDLARCQREHGDGWAGSIPEQYLDWIAKNPLVSIDAEEFETDISLRSEFVRLALNDNTLSDAERSRLICRGWNALGGKAVSE